MWRFLAVAALAAIPLGVLTTEAPALADDPAVRARAIIAGRTQSLLLDNDLTDLRVDTVRKGIAGDYVRFQQTVGGVPVMGAYVTVALPSGGSEPYVTTRYRAAPQVVPIATVVEQPAAVRSALAATGGDWSGLRAPPRVERVMAPQGKALVHAWQVVLPLREPLGTWLVLLDAGTGKLLSMTDVLQYDSGRVFDPSPPVGSGGTIPPPLNCDSTAAETFLAGRYVVRQLSGIAPSQNKLKGQYVDLTAPGIVGAYKPAGQANEPSRSYIYPCTDDRFEEAMVYYHVDAVQRRIQRLGFSGEASVLNGPTPAHAHYFDACNAFYDPVDRGIHFGDSNTCATGVDAAEDADVIVHEYGHAVQDGQVPGWGFGIASQAEQAWAMGEGFADFLAAATFGDTCIGEWFAGFSGCLRNIENANHFPEAYNACRPDAGQPAEPHCAGLIWGGALWDLVQALGSGQQARDTVLTLVLEAHFMLDPVSTFAEAADAIREADAMLYGGAHDAIIGSVFAARGIGSVGVLDFPYAFLRIRHPHRGDLDVDLVVGNPLSPTCTIAIQSPSLDSSDDLVGYVPLGSFGCGTLLPPTVERPWRLQVQDVFPGDVGTIEQFEFALSGSLRCPAVDVPVAIPDAGPAVYSSVNCTTVITGEPADDDGDGYTNVTELHVGTNPVARCGPSGWPADLMGTGGSFNKIDIQDLAAFVAPLRRIDTSPGDTQYLVRFDLLPGNGGLGDHVNIQDLVNITVLQPPMLNGLRAFGNSCP